jgi:hypothetical protein
MNISPLVSTPGKGTTLLERNRYELGLIVEELKSREARATDPKEQAEIKQMLDTWSQVYRASGGNPDKVKPASFGNDLRMVLAGQFPVLDPQRYDKYTNTLAENRTWQTAACGQDKEVLQRREKALEASLKSQKMVDRMSSGGLALAQLSWMAAIPAYMVAGSAGLVGCAGALFAGLGLITAANSMQHKPLTTLMQMTPPGDVNVLAHWMEKGPQLVEEHLKRQAEVYNSVFKLAEKPESVAIAERQGHIQVGGVRLKTREPRA